MDERLPDACRAGLKRARVLDRTCTGSHPAQGRVLNPPLYGLANVSFMAGVTNRLRWFSLLLLAVGLLSACAGAADAPTGSGVVRSAPPIMTIDVQRGWSFKTDPSGQADWSNPNLDTSGWDVIDAGEGEFWQSQGYAGYAGTAWYRRSVDVPASWQGRSAYLAIGGVNDEYAVYVDGRKQGGAGDFTTRQSAVQRPTATPVQLTAGKVNVVAVQVRSWYNFGGIVHGPVALTTAPVMPSSAVDQALAYAAKHPNGMWPAWMRGQGRNWTVVGTPAGGAETLIGPDGRWEPTAASPSITLAVLDKGTGKLLGAPPGSWSLQDRHLPLVSFDWRQAGVQVSSQLWRPTSGPDAARWAVRLTNIAAGTGQIRLYIMIDGYQVQPGVAPLFSVEYRAGAVLVNGQPFLTVGQPPSTAAASTGEVGDVSELVASGSLGSRRLRMGRAWRPSRWDMTSIWLPDRVRRWISQHPFILP